MASLLRIVLIGVNCGFGLLVLCGSLFEVANLLDPTLVPSIQDAPFMRVHHTEPAVFRWTLGSNLVTPFLGAGLIAVGVGLLRRRPWVERASRIAAMVAVAIAVGGLVVCAVYLMPIAFADLNALEPERQASGLILLLAMPAASFGVAMMPLLSWLGVRRLVRA